MFDATPTRPATIVNCCPIVELRQYTCRTGRRDALIDLFEREFVDAHETVGIRQLGQFRNLDDPDNFVWIRGFPEPEARRRTLPAFYESAAWETHKEQALATLAGWDNALQLRRTHASSGFALPSAPRSKDVDPPPAALVVATLYSLTDPIDDRFIRFFEDGVRTAMPATGASPIASFQTDHSENPYPRLPLRTGENMFVWFTTFATVEEHREHVARLGESRHWKDGVAPELARRLGAASRAHPDPISSARERRQTPQLGEIPGSVAGVARALVASMTAGCRRGSRWAGRRRGCVGRGTRARRRGARARRRARDHVAGCLPGRRVWGRAKRPSMGRTSQDPAGWRGRCWACGHVWSRGASKR